MLLVDAGGSLSAATGQEDEGERTRARAILRAMGRMGYDAMAVGERDLVLAPQELKAAAQRAKVTLLAANVVDAKGRRPFEAHKLVKVGGIPVGVFAVTSGQAFERHGLKVLDPLAQARSQVQALRKAGARLVVALVHLEYDAALTLASKLKGVDFAIQATDSRVAGTQTVGSVVMAPAGERGQQVGRAEIKPGAAPLFDLSDAASALEQLRHLEQSIARLKEESRARPEYREQNEARLRSYQRHRDSLLARSKAKPPRGRGTIRADFVTLSRHVPEDPEIVELLSQPDSD